MHRKVQFCHQEILLFFAVSSPCSENNGGCEQLCFSFPNRTEPKCQCATGVLDKNGKSCNGILFILSHSIIVLLIFFVLTFLNNEKL